MEKKRIERFKKQLLERRQELLKSIAQTQEEGRAMQHSYGPDEGDRANSSLDKELLFQQTTHARGLLGGIDAALTRIADGTLRRGNRREAPRGLALDALLHLLPGKF